MKSSVCLLAELTPAVGDIVFSGVAVAFFALARAFAWFCEKVR